MVSFDKGPPAALANHFAQLPDIPADFQKFFWNDWGPVFYRGPPHRQGEAAGDRLRPGSDRARGRTHPRGRRGPAGAGFPRQARADAQLRPGERVPGRRAPVAGVPGQAAALRQGPAEVAQPLLRPGHRSRAPGDRGLRRQRRRRRQPLGRTSRTSRRSRCRTPRTPTTSCCCKEWRTAIPDLRALVTPDNDGSASGPNYGTTFKESDYHRIPAEDLPFGLPPWVGDDSWGRRAKPRHNNSVKRDSKRPRPHPDLAGAESGGPRLASIFRE